MNEDDLRGHVINAAAEIAARVNDEERPELKTNATGVYEEALDFALEALRYKLEQAGIDTGQIKSFITLDHDEANEHCVGAAGYATEEGIDAASLITALLFHTRALARAAGKEFAVGFMNDEGGVNVVP